MGIDPTLSAVRPRTIFRAPPTSSPTAAPGPAAAAARKTAFAAMSGQAYPRPPPPPARPPGRQNPPGLHCPPPAAPPPIPAPLLPGTSHGCVTDVSRRSASAMTAGGYGKRTVAHHAIVVEVAKCFDDSYCPVRAVHIKCSRAHAEAVMPL